MPGLSPGFCVYGRFEGGPFGYEPGFRVRSRADLLRTRIHSFSPE